MKRLIAILTAALLLLSGCSVESLLQSADYRAMEDIAEDINDGDTLTKSDIFGRLGKPNCAYFDHEDSYMASSCRLWSYEEFDFSGYPYGLSVHFDQDGVAVSAAFGPAPGG